MTEQPRPRTIDPLRDVRNYDEDGPQPPSELGDAAQPSISSEPPCPHCSVNYRNDEPMEVQYVCEQCGHRESVPDAAPPVEPEEGLTPEEWNVCARAVDEYGIRYAGLAAKIRRIAGTVSSPMTESPSVNYASVVPNSTRPLLYSGVCSKCGSVARPDKPLLAATPVSLLLPDTRWECHPPCAAPPSPEAEPESEVCEFHHYTRNRYAASYREAEPESEFEEAASVLTKMVEPDPMQRDAAREEVREILSPLSRLYREAVALLPKYEGVIAVVRIENARLREDNASLRVRAEKAEGGK